MSPGRATFSDSGGEFGPQPADHAGAFERWLDAANFDEQGRQRIRLSELTAPALVSRG